MPQRDNSYFFLAYTVCAILFIVLTGLAMPSLVASHFGANGVANGYMSRAAYLMFMVVFIIGLPIVMVFITRHAMTRNNARINLPNRDFWLSPERRTETINFLRTGVLKFGFLLTTFLCYVHWLVVRANEAQPVHLDESWFLGGLATFIIALFVWLKIFIGHFRSRQ